EKPAEKPTEKPTEKPAEKPTEKPAEKPAEKPIDVPKAKPTGKPIDINDPDDPKTKTTEEPAEKPTEKPIDVPTDVPKVDDPKTKPTEEPAEKPTEKPIDVPTDVPKVDDPKTKTTEEPAEKPTDTTTKTTINIDTPTVTNTNIDTLTNSPSNPAESITTSDNGSSNTETATDQFIPPTTLPIKVTTLSKNENEVATTTTFAPDLPRVIVSDNNESPPPNSVFIKIKLQLPWDKIVANDVVPVQIMDFLPKDLAKAGGIPSEEIKPISLEASDGGEVLLNIAIPGNKVNIINDVIKNPTSSFYTNATTPELNHSVDSTSLVSSEPDNNNNNLNPTVNGPILPNSTQGDSSDSSNKGLVIGLAVTGSALLYAGLTALVIRAYRRSKLRSLQQQNDANYNYGADLGTGINNVNDIGDGGNGGVDM
ncbi:9943_t:CDS:2, partial [Entrophospora sp. SA101]